MKSFKKFLFISIFALGFCFIATSIAFANQAPIADAGPDFYLDSGEQAMLNGFAQDIDGDFLTYSWFCTGGYLSNSTIEKPYFTAPGVSTVNKKDIINCTFTVRDNQNLSNSDTLKIYVNYEEGGETNTIDVKTKLPTSVYSNKSVLNGSFENTSTNKNAKYAWFQYGFSQSYGSETSKQLISTNSGSFSQEISNLYLNGTYHYRAVVEDQNGNKFYGQDVVFITQSNFYNSGTLTVSKKSINLTRGNFIWTETLNVCPNDILSFSISITAQGTDFHNVVIKENLPTGLIYNDNLLINAEKNYSENPFSGINIGTIKEGEIVIVSYQVKVAGATSFPYGQSTLISQTTISDDETVTDSIVNSIIVDNTQVSGASTTNPTDIATGLTNNLFTESFLLPMLLIIFCSWFYFSGNVYVFADWINTKIN